jgi:indole-3-glycerol phosphate synthase
VLVEVHDDRELSRAVDAGARVVGVNNRNLRTLDVSLDVSDRLIARMPSGVVAIAESGLKSRDDLTRLRAAGYHGFLIGEQLMSAPDPGEALSALIR